MLQRGRAAVFKKPQRHILPMSNGNWICCRAPLLRPAYIILMHRQHPAPMTLCSAPLARIISIAVHSECGLLIAKNAKCQIKLKLMGSKVLLCDHWEGEREEEAARRTTGAFRSGCVHSESSYGLPITALHCGRLMSAHVAG